MSAQTETENIVHLTESAAAQIRTIQADDPAKQGKPLRLFIEAGGCSGMQYGMDFDEEREGDAKVERSGVAVVVDKISADYLRGTELDYVDALTGGGFKIKNPNAKQSCGCGKSFEA